MSELATFAAGCFWGVESEFRKFRGVSDTRVGYVGGHAEKPTYKDVCSGNTGHAEAVEVTFDPEKVSFEELLTLFFTLHDPTTKNRQGPDIGSQYRSVVFYHDDAQKQAAERYIAGLNDTGKFSRPVVTEVVPTLEFFEAEDYHQQYFEKRGVAH